MIKFHSSKCSGGSQIWLSIATRKPNYTASYTGEDTAGSLAKDESSHSQNRPFVAFITSNHVVQDLPFGERTITLSTRETIKVPNVIRTLLPERIVKHYSSYCKESGFHPLGRTILLRVLKTCSICKKITSRTWLLQLFRSRSIWRIVTTCRYFRDKEWVGSRPNNSGFMKASSILKAT